MGIIERSYSTVLVKLFRLANPIKKKIIKTECEVHKFINNQGLLILKNDGYMSAYNLLSMYINQINAGAVWADQDFKSANHFYNPDKKRGLYGRSNAYREYMLFYTKAINKYYGGKVESAMFYLGAACHLAQDLTVPQHANIRLMNSHRRYEKWVIRAYKKHDLFKVSKGGIYLNSPIEYIDYNSKRAISTYMDYKHEVDTEKRFYDITSIILLIAQKTTAGLMMNFYRDIERMKPFILKNKDKKYYKFIKGR